MDLIDIEDEISMIFYEQVLFFRHPRPASGKIQSVLRTDEIQQLHFCLRYTCHLHQSLRALITGYQSVTQISSDTKKCAFRTENKKDFCHIVFSAFSFTMAADFLFLLLINHFTVRMKIIWRQQKTL